MARLDVKSIPNSTTLDVVTGRHLQRTVDALITSINSQPAIERPLLFIDMTTFSSTSKQPLVGALNSITVVKPTLSGSNMSAPVPSLTGDRWGVKALGSAGAFNISAARKSDGTNVLLEDPNNLGFMTSSVTFSTQGFSALWHYDGTQWLIIGSL